MDEVETMLGEQGSINLCLGRGKDSVQPGMSGSMETNWLEAGGKDQAGIPDQQGKNLVKVGQEKPKSQGYGYECGTSECFPGYNLPCTSYVQGMAQSEHLFARDRCGRTGD